MVIGARSWNFARVALPTVIAPAGAIISWDGTFRHSVAIAARFGAWHWCVAIMTFPTNGTRASAAIHLIAARYAIHTGTVFTFLLTLADRTRIAFITETGTVVCEDCASDLTVATARAITRKLLLAALACVPVVTLAGTVTILRITRDRSMAAAGNGAPVSVAAVIAPIVWVALTATIAVVEWILCPGWHAMS